jgi:hypothetical protein
MNLIVLAVLFSLVGIAYLNRDRIVYEYNAVFLSDPAHPSVASGAAVSSVAGSPSNQVPPSAAPAPKVSPVAASPSDQVPPSAASAPGVSAVAVSPSNQVPPSAASAPAVSAVAASPSNQVPPSAAPAPAVGPVAASPSNPAPPSAAPAPAVSAVAATPSDPAPPSAAPAPAVSAVAGGSVAPSSSADTSILLARGDSLLAAGDIVSSRLFYERAASAGNGEAALRLGATYDPAFLGRIRALVKGDQGQALHWYRRALELGQSEAANLLKADQAKKD